MTIFHQVTLMTCSLKATLRNKATRRFLRLFNHADSLQGRFPAPRGMRIQRGIRLQADLRAGTAPASQGGPATAAPETARSAKNRHSAKQRFCANPDGKTFPQPLPGSMPRFRQPPDPRPQQGSQTGHRQGHDKDRMNHTCAALRNGAKGTRTTCSSPRRPP